MLPDALSQNFPGADVEVISWTSRSLSLCVTKRGGEASGVLCFDGVSFVRLMPKFTAESIRTCAASDVPENAALPDIDAQSIVFLIEGASVRPLAIVAREARYEVSHIGMTHASDGSWIYEENLRPFFETLSLLVGDTFSPEEWNVISAGVAPTDVEKENWFDSTIGSENAAVTLEVARDRGSAIIYFRVRSDDAGWRERVKTAALIFQTYAVGARSRLAS